MADVQQTDVLVLGATGFTGRLTARYLSTHPDFLDRKFTFALGGRSPQKLAKVAAELGVDETAVPHVHVDVLDSAQVTQAVQGARVVINAVGPYWRWGKLVVKCVPYTLLCFLTSDRKWQGMCGKRSALRRPDWRATLHATRRHRASRPHLSLLPPAHPCSYRYHAIAQSTHAILIPCSGHDSIPADASAFLSAQALKQFAGADANVVRSESRFKGSGGISGGTLDSLLVTLEEVSAPELRAAAANYAYSPGSPFAFLLITRRAHS